MKNPIQVIVREPGNGVRYVALITDLSSLPLSEGRTLGVGAGPAYQVTLANFPGRPSIIVTNTVVVGYLMEKCPGVNLKDAEVFAGICNEALTNSPNGAK